MTSERGLVWSANLYWRYGA